MQCYTATATVTTYLWYSVLGLILGQGAEWKNKWKITERVGNTTCMNEWGGNSLKMSHNCWQNLTICHFIRTLLVSLNTKEWKISVFFLKRSGKLLWLGCQVSPKLSDPRTLVPHQYCVLPSLMVTPTTRQIRHGHTNFRTWSSIYGWMCLILGLSVARSLWPIVWN